MKKVDFSIRFGDLGAFPQSFSHPCGKFLRLPVENQTEQKHKFFCEFWENFSVEKLSLIFSKCLILQKKDARANTTAGSLSPLQSIR